MSENLPQTQTTPVGPDKPRESNEKIDLRILFAEDNPDIRFLLELTLNAKYTSVEGVENGELLVNKLSDPTYKADFIITDNTMPKMTGIEAIKKIRALDHLKTIPIVMYTSDPAGSLQAEAEKLNLNVVFVQKPAKAEVLYAAIESLRQKK